MINSRNNLPILPKTDKCMIFFALNYWNGKNFLAERSVFLKKKNLKKGKSITDIKTVLQSNRSKINFEKKKKQGISRFYLTVKHTTIILPKMKHKFLKKRIRIVTKKIKFKISGKNFT